MITKISSNSDILIFYQNEFFLHILDVLFQEMQEEHINIVVSYTNKR